MGGCRCSYKNCKNTTKSPENLHFFHYPVKYKERCKVWIENANKPHFCDLEEEQLRNKVICEMHFEDRWFPNSQKKRLLQGAIPTLDEGCEEEPQPKQSLYMSQHLQDVQVLPANADGTIFILDTDTLYNRSQKVESYIYKNGAIYKKNKPAVNFAKPSTSSNFAYDKEGVELDSSKTKSMYKNVKLYDDPKPASDYKVMIKNEQMDISMSTADNSMERMNYMPKLLNDQQMQPKPHYLMQSEDVLEEEPEILNASASASQPVRLKSISRSVIEKSVGRNYLRKIKQHSRDIACIKRMLKQKSPFDNKPDNQSVLNSLKDQLPPTLLTILKLNLDDKYVVSEEEIDFFSTIHKSGPEVYQLLIDKYKWNLPSKEVPYLPEDNKMEGVEKEA